MHSVFARPAGARPLAITMVSIAVIALVAASSRGQSPRRANVVTVVATDFAFGMPDVVPAGLTIFELQNHGRETHHMSVARLDSGRTMADGVAAMIKSGRNVRPPWMHAVGGPNAAMPGGNTNATLVLAPGSYFAYCEIPGPDPTRHYMKGMAKAFSVTAPSQGGVLPRADIVMELVDFDFVLSHPLTHGPHVVAVTNSAKQAHMVAIRRFPLDYPRGHAAEELTAWAHDPKGVMAPGIAVGGVTEIASGDTVIVRQNFEPGMYLLICFSTNEADGQPHFRHGMQKELIVK